MNLKGETTLLFAQLALKHPVIFAVALIILLVVGIVILYFFWQAILAVIFLTIIIAMFIFAVIGIRKTKAPIPAHWKAFLIIGFILVALFTMFNVPKMFDIAWSGDYPYDEWTCTVTSIYPYDGECVVSPPTFVATINTDCPYAKVSFEYTSDTGTHSSKVECGYISIGSGTHTVTYSPVEHGHTADEWTVGNNYAWTIIVWNFTGMSGSAIWQKDGTVGSYDFYWHYPIGQQTLTVSTYPTNGGTVTLTPAGGAYDVGEVITLIAEPKYGYRFDKWVSTDFISSDNPYQLTMPAHNVEVTAHFVKEAINPLYIIGIMVAVAVVGGIYWRWKR